MARIALPALLLAAFAAVPMLSWSGRPSASARQHDARAQVTTAPAPALPLPPPPPERPKPRGVHRMAVVDGSVPLRARPNGRVLARAGASTELGGRRVLSVAARRGAWLGVVTTEMPNGQLAWVNRRNSALHLRR